MLSPPSAMPTYDLPMPGRAIISPDCPQREDSGLYDVYVMLAEAQQDLLSKEEEFRRWLSIV